MSSFLSPTEIEESFPYRDVKLKTGVIPKDEYELSTTELGRLVFGSSHSHFSRKLAKYIVSIDCILELIDLYDRDRILTPTKSTLKVQRIK